MGAAGKAGRVDLGGGGACGPAPPLRWWETKKGKWLWQCSHCDFWSWPNRVACHGCRRPRTDKCGGLRGL